MTDGPGLALAGLALAVAFVNVAFFGKRPVLRGVALSFTGAPGAAGAGAARIWWLIPVWLVLTAWGLLGLAHAKGTLDDRGPEKGEDE